MRLTKSATIPTIVIVVLAALLGQIGPLGPARSAAAPLLSQRTHLFYYSWYGSPSVNGSWRHWPQGGHTPPADIGANFYPALGAYDSGDTAAVLPQHMQWIQQSGAGVIVYSWWGQGSYEDGLARRVLDAAGQYGIKVAWHLEPYGGRSAASTVSDIRYINQQYGGHPAFYRDAEHGNRPAFYIFSSLDIADWSALAQVNQANIILAQTTDSSKVQFFGGMYTYDGIAGLSAPGWKQAADYCRQHGLVWAPSVAPGYLDDRAVPGNSTPTVDRGNGSVYDQQWSNALATATGGLPDWVSVTSFNEWHEGSQIEPASGAPPAGLGYQTYLNAYGRSDASAALAYLDRTAYWAGRFETLKGQPGATPSPTAAPTRTPTPAPTATPGAGQQPYGGAARAIPGTVQAEDFDEGGEGLAYHDSDPANSGGQYRAGGVDIESAGDSGGGYNVGWMRPDEWLEYTVNVQSAGSYTLVARVASGASGGRLRVEFGGVDQTGEIGVGNTGGWQSWADVSRTVSLGAGQQVMRVYVTGADVNLNYLRFSPAAANRALGRPASASSAVSASYPAASAVDGSQASYWESANGSWPQSLTVDLGASVSVSRVVVKLPAGWEPRSQSIALLGSADGASYSTLVGAASYAFSPAGANTVTISFPAVSRRYLRLSFSANSGWPAAQVAELEVY